jgi:hypothetical protein
MEPSKLDWVGNQQFILQWEDCLCMDQQQTWLHPSREQFSKLQMDIMHMPHTKTHSCLFHLPLVPQVLQDFKHYPHTTTSRYNHLVPSLMVKKHLA